MMNLLLTNRIEGFLDRYGLFIIIILTAFLSFWKLGHHPLEEWDESRRGMNALGMIEQHDFINYYYGDERDIINAKPPLAIWLIVINYYIFGYGEFALRFHSALGIILAFFFIYKLGLVYLGNVYSFLTCLILLGCKGLIGYHVGRNGDTDALLILFLLAGTYYFLNYLDFNKPNLIYLSAIFFGLAFYSKGFAAFFYFPGILLYVLLKGAFKKVMKDKRIWIACLIFLMVISSWFLLLTIFGANYQVVEDTGKNSLETLFFYDIIQRFFALNFGSEYDPWYFFDVMDAGFNLWNYVFYSIIIITLYLLISKRIILKKYFRQHSNQLLLFSIIISISIMILLTISRNKCRWYLALIYPFVVILTVKGMLFLVKRWFIFKYIWIGLILFTLVRHFLYLNTPKESIKILFDLHQSELLSSDSIHVYGHLPQDAFLYLKWTNKNVHFIKSKNLFKEYVDEGAIIFTNLENIDSLKLTEEKHCYKSYCFLNL